MDLVILYCLAGAPQDCREERIAMSPTARPAAGSCVDAMAEAVRFAIDHPEYALTGWRCGGRPEARR